MKELTSVFLVGDMSSSMRDYGRDHQLRTSSKEYVDTIMAMERQTGLNFDITPIRFADTVTVGGTFKPHDTLSAPSLFAIFDNAYGNTALRDAIGLALDKALALKHPSLIHVLTDGEENTSRLYSVGRLTALIKQAEETGRITLSVVGPASALAYLKAMGVPEGNFRPWDGSIKEAKEASRDTVKALETYSVGRTKGVRSTNSFYADANKLTTSGVRGFTKKVEPAEIKVVTKAMAGRTISDFYASKFKAGNHFYELIKPEYVQDDKDMIVLIKADNEYRLGSRSVRQLLGLPETGKVRVHPGPVSEKFQIFVQSNSVNRKTVEGQHMLSLD